MTNLLLFAGAAYLVLLFVANATAGRRCNPWNITLVDRVWFFPLEIAFMTLGWLVENAALVAAAMIPLVPLALILWFLWAVE